MINGFLKWLSGFKKKNYLVYKIKRTKKKKTIPSFCTNFNLVSVWIHNCICAFVFSRVFCRDK